VILDAQELTRSAVAEAGSEEFGDDDFLEPLAVLVGSLEAEGQLSDLGAEIIGYRLRTLLTNRLRVEATIAAEPSIADETVTAPIFIIGLPRTGTTALSNLVAADPQIRSLRLWESTDPVPPPTTATERDDPRIAATEQGLAAMYATFPKMRALYFQTATGPSECQDLLGMSFRTAHFDGMAHVPAYRAWVLDCDMAPAYRMHRRTLQLLQWRCPPRLWHLKTPVHMLALPALAAAYPDARFLWTHRDPAAVMGSVCSLISHTRSWVSDQDESRTVGEEQVALWELALRRALAFREAAGEDRFGDVTFDDLHTDPVRAVAGAYESIGLELGPEGRARLGAWSAAHPPGAHGTHEYALDTFGLEADAVRRQFAFYLERFAIDPADPPRAME
jgi:hypothetical protein